MNDFIIFYHHKNKNSHLFFLRLENDSSDKAFKNQIDLLREIYQDTICITRHLAYVKVKITDDDEAFKFKLSFKQNIYD